MPSAAPSNCNTITNRCGSIGVSPVNNDHVETAGKWQFACLAAFPEPLTALGKIEPRARVHSLCRLNPLRNAGQAADRGWQGATFGYLRTTLRSRVRASG